MKLINKQDIQFENGRFIVGDELIGFEYPVANVVNYLEHMYQAAVYKLEVAEARKQQAKEPEPFKFESAFACGAFELEAETPALDEQIERSKRIMEDLDRAAYASKANDIIRAYNLDGLVKWMAADKVAVSFDVIEPEVDAKFIGNPLELDEERLSTILSVIGKATVLQEL